MWPTRLMLATLAASLILAPSVQAIESSSVEMWECPGPEGTILYTNKERPDCQPKALKALSVVPSLPDMPISPSIGGSTYQPSPKTKDFSYDTPIGRVAQFIADPGFRARLVCRQHCRRVGPRGSLLHVHRVDSPQSK